MLIFALSVTFNVLKHAESVILMQHIETLLGRKLEN